MPPIAASSVLIAASPAHEGGAGKVGSAGRPPKMKPFAAIHESSRITLPSTRNGTLWPGIANDGWLRPKRPCRGPRMTASTSASIARRLVHDARAAGIDEAVAEVQLAAHFRQPAAAPDPVGEERDRRARR